MVINTALKVTVEPALHSSDSQQPTAQSPEISSQAFFSTSHVFWVAHAFITAVLSSFLIHFLKQRSNTSGHSITFFFLSASSLSFAQ